MKNFTNYLAVLALTVLVSSVAQAHTTSIGFFNAGVGSVTFVTGSYQQFANPVNEGELTLEGINGTVFASTAKAFDIAPTSTKYSQLVDGDNNFYWATDRTLDKTLTVDPNIGGGVVVWQAVTFTGLTAGDYQFGCGSLCGTSIQWDSFGTGTGTLTLSGAIVGTPPSGVPEASSIILLGLGLAGLGFTRRQKKA